MHPPPPPKNILFLTTPPAPIAKAERIQLQRWNLIDLLEAAGAKVTLKSWRDETTLSTIHEHDVITFLWCSEYFKYPLEFLSFLEELDKAVKAAPRSPRVINHVEMVRWNADKKYLLDVRGMGFQVPRMSLVDAEELSVSELQRHIVEFKASGAVVLKPAMSASSTMTRRIVDTASLTSEDVAFLDLCTQGELQSSLVLQEFEPSISTGEYSFIFIGQKLSHVTLKSPKKGDFRVQSAFGGSSGIIDMNTVPKESIEEVQRVFDCLHDRFGNGSTGVLGYLRLDGLITSDRPFVLMEVEAIEPYLWLEGGNAMEELVALLVAA